MSVSLSRVWLGLTFCSGLILSAGATSIHVSHKLFAAPSSKPTLRAPIIVQASIADNDKAGVLLLQTLRSDLVSDKRLSLAEDKAATGFTIHLVSVTPVKDGSATVYGETITLRMPGQPEQYVSSTVSVCGISRIHDCAHEMVDEMTHTLDAFIKAVEKNKKIPNLSDETYAT